MTTCWIWLAGFLDHRRNEQISPLSARLSTEGENLGDQVLGPVPGPFDRLQVFNKLFIRQRRTQKIFILPPPLLGQAVEQQIGIAKDGPEDVIEIMGNTTGEGGDGFQLMGVHKTFFQITLMADILGGIDETDNAPLIEQWRATDRKSAPKLTVEDDDGIHDGIKGVLPFLAYPLQHDADRLRCGGSCFAWYCGVRSGSRLRRWGDGNRCLESRP